MFLLPPQPVAAVFLPSPHVLCLAALLSGCEQNTMVVQAEAGFELLILLPGSDGISGMYSHTLCIAC